MYCLRAVRVHRRSVRLLKFGIRSSLPDFLMDVLGWGQSRLDRYLFAAFGLMAPLGQFAVGQSVAATYGTVTRPAKVLAQRMVGRELERDREMPRYLESSTRTEASGSSWPSSRASFSATRSRCSLRPTIGASG